MGITSRYENEMKPWKWAVIAMMVILVVFCTWTLATKEIQFKEITYNVDNTRTIVQPKETIINEPTVPTADCVIVGDKSKSLFTMSCIQIDANHQIGDLTWMDHINPGTDNPN